MMYFDPDSRLCVRRWPVRGPVKARVGPDGLARAGPELSAAARGPVGPDGLARAGPELRRRPPAGGA